MLCSLSLPDLASVRIILGDNPAEQVNGNDREL